MGATATAPGALTRAALVASSRSGKQALVPRKTRQCRVRRSGRARWRSTPRAAREASVVCVCQPGRCGPASAPRTPLQVGARVCPPRPQHSLEGPCVSLWRHYLGSSQEQTRKANSSSRRLPGVAAGVKRARRPPHPAQGRGAHAAYCHSLAGDAHDHRGLEWKRRQRGRPQHPDRLGHPPRLR